MLASLCGLAACAACLAPPSAACPQSQAAGSACRWHPPAPAMSECARPRANACTRTAPAQGRPAGRRRPTRRRPPSSSLARLATPRWRRQRSSSSGRSSTSALSRWAVGTDRGTAVPPSRAAVAAAACCGALVHDVGGRAWLRGGSAWVGNSSLLHTYWHELYKGGGGREEETGLRQGCCSGGDRIGDGGARGGAQGRPLHSPTPARPSLTTQPGNQLASAVPRCAALCFAGRAARQAAGPGGHVRLRRQRAKRRPAGHVGRQQHAQRGGHGPRRRRGRRRAWRGAGRGAGRRAGRGRGRPSRLPLLPADTAEPAVLAHIAPAVPAPADAVPAADRHAPGTAGPGAVWGLGQPAGGRRKHSAAQRHCVWREARTARPHACGQAYMHVGGRACGYWWQLPAGPTPPARSLARPPLHRPPPCQPLPALPCPPALPLHSSKPWLPTAGPTPTCETGTT